MSAIAALGLVLALQAATPAPTQFDLICTETAHSGRPSTPEYRFRLDLDLNRWCEGTCESPRPIAAITADRYTLVDSEYRGRSLRTTNHSWIDRISGKHWEQNTAIGGLTQIESREGQCERAPFSGMPAARF